MGLMVDNCTKEKLTNRLKEFTKFGMTIYFLLEEERIKPCEIEKIFFSPDDEKSTFLYCRLMKSIKPSDVETSFEKYKEEYPNKDNLPLSKYEKYLNKIYISKIIDKLQLDEGQRIDKTYVNTYNYLLEFEYN